MTRLFIIRGPRPGQSFDLRYNVLTIGRASGNDIQIKDPSVSRKHARISKKDGSFFLEDLKSVNGTWVEGRLLKPGQRAVVKEGSLIAVGGTLITLGEDYPVDGRSPRYAIDLGEYGAGAGKPSLHKDRRMMNRRNLELIYELSTVFMQPFDISTLCAKIMEAVFPALKRIDSGAVLLVNFETAQLEQVAGRVRESDRDVKIDYSRTVVNRVIREGKAMVMSDTSQEDKAHLSDSIEMMGIKSIMCVPLITKSVVRGVIYVHSVRVPHGFRREDLFFLTALSSPAAVAVENALLLSKQRQAEKALRENEEKYRLLTETAQDIILMMDLDGRINYINKGGVETAGYRKEDVLGADIAGFLPPDQAPVLKDHLAKRLAGDKEVHLCETALVSGTGERIPVEVSSALIMKRGRPSSVLLTARDIRERKRAGEELLKVQKLESLVPLAGGIAHDFNNILTRILGNIDLAQMDMDPKDRAYKSLNDAQEACMNAAELTEKFLVFARGESPVKQIAALDGLIVDTAHLAVTGSNGRCEFSIPDDLWMARFDRDQIRQVINNLVVNAKDAMPKGGIISVMAENVVIKTEKDDQGMPMKNGPYVKITIRDQGVGIPKEHLNKIFDPYFSTKESWTEQGMGLGLSTAYSIVKGHDGYIRADSQIGEGTSVLVYLPACREEEMEERPSAEQGPVFGQGRILLMDDEELVRDTAAEMLRRIGYEVVLAQEGGEVIDLYKQAEESGRPFDAVILDLTVRDGMGGKETLQRLLKLDSKVRGIVSSGYPGNPVLVGFINYGFRGAIAKPYRMEEIGRVLRDVLGSS